MNFEFSLSTSGIEFQEVAVDISGKLKTELLNRVGEYALGQTLFRVPFKTGELASSFTKELSSDNVTIKPNAPHAIYVSLGTRPHNIYPVHSRTLRFEAAGGIKFAKHVFHPGTRPNPYLEEALEATKEQIEPIFAQLWLEII